MLSWSFVVPGKTAQLLVISQPADYHRKCACLPIRAIVTLLCARCGGERSPHCHLYIIYVLFRFLTYHPVSCLLTRVAHYRCASDLTEKAESNLPNHLQPNINLGHCIVCCFAMGFG